MAFSKAQQLLFIILKKKLIIYWRIDR